MSAKGDDSADATVLIVEDDRGLANLYSLWLSDRHEVKTAHSGSEALEMIDESIDVVLLDRRMPGVSGDDVLRAVRARGFDCRVAMVTAVPPEEEIADLPIDEYLTKPIERDRIEAAVEDLLFRTREDASKQEFLALLSKKIALEDERPREALESSPEYDRLRRRIERIRGELDVAPRRTSSKYRPDACPNCGLRWDVTVEDVVGFVHLGTHVWKCIDCGEVVRHMGAYGRDVARR